MTIDTRITGWAAAGMPEPVRLPAPAEGVLEVQILDDPTSLDWYAGVQVEAGVFIEKGYVDSAEELGSEYERYLGSTAMITIKSDEQTVGALRVIDYDPAVGFKTEHDIDEGRLLLDAHGKQIMANLNRPQTLEAGTIALPEELRASHGKKYAAILYGALYMLAQSRGKQTVIASFDAGYYGGFSRKYPDLSIAVGPAVHYMGSPTIPAVLDVAKASMDRFI